MSTNPSVLEVPIGQLRELFNNGRYWDRARWGDLYQTVEEEGHPSPPLAGEPYCTRSQIVAYRNDDGHQVARVHQYLRPDQTIGLSGRPDPRQLLQDGVLYIPTLPEEGSPG